MSAHAAWGTSRGSGELAAPAASANSNAAASVVQPESASAPAAAAAAAVQRLSISDQPSTSATGAADAAAAAGAAADAALDPAHATMILRGLCSLRQKSVLTDVTLLAEGQRFHVHKVILVSCSDYFHSMFTSGMKECSQSEIELKGVTAKGLEKVLDIIYTSTTSIEGDDVFDILAAATHLQVMPVLEFCERNFLSGMTPYNFNDFISTARLYNMSGVLAQIDKFIATNLLSIADGPALSQLTIDQMLTCLRSQYCTLHEIDLFRIVQLWIAADAGNREQYLEQLLTEIRYTLISPSDLVTKVQKSPAIMDNPTLHSILLQALNYHVVPQCQPLRTAPDMGLRCYREAIVCIGGRELQPQPGLIEDCSVLLGSSRQHLCLLPTPISHAQCVQFNNFLFVIGGCVTQCGHGESAVNTCMRYDLRFNAWYQCAPMLQRRAYFTAALIANRNIIVVGGKKKEGALASCEYYDPEENTWTPAPSLQLAFHAHAGLVHKDIVYISGGYSNDNFYPDMQKLRPNSEFWEECAPMLTARGWHCMVEANDLFYVCGGCSLNASNQALPVLQCEQYNPSTDQWTIIASMPVSHKEACALRFGNRIYVLGGFNVQTKTGQKLISRLELDSCHWETVGSFGQSLTGVGCCVLKLPSFLVQFDY